MVSKKQPKQPQAVSSQPEASTEAHLHVFQWQSGAVNILRDLTNMGIHEFDEGLEAYLEAGQYHLLPGSHAPVEIWESSSEEATNKFLVVGHYGTMTLAFHVEHVKGLRSWLKEYQPLAAILPYVVFPEPVQAPNNHVFSGPIIKPVRW